MKRALVTGCTGLVAFELVNELLRGLAFKVYGLSRSKPAIISPNFVHIAGDLTGGEFERLLPADIDVVFHLAQSEHFRDYPQKALDIFNVNTASTVRLLNYAKITGVKKFVYASSGGIYGSGSISFTEDEVLPVNRELGFYLSTKLCSEILAENYSAYMDVIICRLFFVYGSRQKRSMLLPRLVDNVIAGKPVTLQGQDGVRINPIHVKDAARALASVLHTSESAVYNIAGAEQLTIREIAKIIGEKTGRQPVFEQSAAAPGDLVGDIGKMLETLHVPEITFERGIAELIP